MRRIAVLAISIVTILVMNFSALLQAQEVVNKLVSKDELFQLLRKQTIAEAAGIENISITRDQYIHSKRYNQRSGEKIN